MARALPRRVEPELLDTLAPRDPRARRARSELRLVNTLMGNARFVAEALAPAARRGARIADLGAGDGRFMLQVARRLRTPLEVTLVDRHSALDAATLRGLLTLGWQARGVAADALAWLERAPAQDAIVANLFLHHLDPAPLERLLALAAERCALFVACEPRRSAPALAASRSLGLIGCAAVTRHDAVASVRAGFAGRELTHAWRAACGSPSGWQLSEGPRGLFSHVFIARRVAV
jgi:hypothetical protein